MKQVKQNSANIDSKVHEEVQKVKDDFDRKIKLVENQMSQIMSKDILLNPEK